MISGVLRVRTGTRIICMYCLSYVPALLMAMVEAADCGNPDNEDEEQGILILSRMPEKHILQRIPCSGRVKKILTGTPLLFSWLLSPIRRLFFPEVEPDYSPLYVVSARRQIPGIDG